MLTGTTLRDWVLDSLAMAGVFAIAVIAVILLVTK